MSIVNAWLLYHLQGFAIFFFHVLNNKKVSTESECNTCVNLIYFLPSPKCRLLKPFVIIITKNRGKEKHFPERLATMLAMLFGYKMYETHYIAIELTVVLNVNCVVSQTHSYHLEFKCILHIVLGQANSAACV